MIWVPLVLGGGVIAAWAISQNIRDIAYVPDSDAGKVIAQAALPFAIVAAAVAIIILAGRR